MLEIFRDRNPTAADKNDKERARVLSELLKYHNNLLARSGNITKA